MGFAEDMKLYRERADAEREIAKRSTLPNVKTRALRSAERWDELAARAALAQAHADNRSSD